MTADWLQVEEKLAGDPRLLAIVRQLRNAVVTPERFNANALRTFALGAWVLLQLRALAHIGHDDVLGIGEDDVDELVGVVGFAKFLPPEWLQILDAHRVKLPGFHGRNGPEAKHRALSGRRVARHRTRVAPKRTTPRRIGNAAALPGEAHVVTLKRYNPGKASDAPSLSVLRSKSKTQRERRSAAAEPLPKEFALTEERREVADLRGLDADRVFAKFTNHFRSTDERLADWDARWRKWCLDERLTPAEAADAKQRKAMAKARSAARAEAIAYAELVGCDMRPREGEPIEAYRALVRQWELSNPRIDARADESGQMRIGRGRI